MSVEEIEQNELTEATGEVARGLPQRPDVAIVHDNTLPDQIRALEEREQFDNLTAERDSLQTRVDRLEQQLGNTRTEHQALDNRLRTKASELDAFREQVVEVASRYADQHGWCSVINDCLRELGLQPRPYQYQATLQVTVSFHAQMNTRRELPSENWVQESVQQDRLRRAIEREFGMDADHAGSSIDEIEFEITDVSEYEED